MMIDSRLMIALSLKPFTEVDVDHAHGKKNDRNDYPKSVLHKVSEEITLFITKYSNSRDIKMA